MIDAHGEGARVHFADPLADVLDTTSRHAVAHVIARLRRWRMPARMYWKDV